MVGDTPTTINWKELSFQLFDLNFLLGGSFLEPRKDEPINKKMPTYLDMTTFNVHQVEEKSQKLYKTLRVCLCVDPVFFPVFTKKIQQNKNNAQLVFESWRAENRFPPSYPLLSCDLCHCLVFHISIRFLSVSYSGPNFFCFVFFFSYLHLMVGARIGNIKGGRFLGRHFEFGSRSRRGWSQSSHGHDIGASSSTPNTCTRGENSIKWKQVE